MARCGVREGGFGKKHIVPLAKESWMNYSLVRTL